MSQPWPESASTRTFARTVLVVEDNDFMRGLISDSLELRGFSVASAASAVDARRLLDRLDPDAVILDIDLGSGPTGLDMAEVIRAKASDVAILFLTSLPDPRFAGKADASVQKNVAYLNKHLLTDTDTLVEALEAVLTERGLSRFRHNELDSRPLANLSRTQIQVLQLLAEGKTNQQIADIRKRSLAATSSAVTRTLEAIGISETADQNVRVAAAVEYVNKVGLTRPILP
jgi:DNA-binding NarL/FixJ family response regulator